MRLDLEWLNIEQFCENYAAIPAQKVDKSDLFLEKNVILDKAIAKQRFSAQIDNFGSFWSNQLSEHRKSVKKGVKAPFATKIVSFMSIYLKRSCNFA